MPSAETSIAIGAGLLLILATSFIIIRKQLKAFAGTEPGIFIHMPAWMKSSHRRSRLGGVMLFTFSFGIMFSSVITALSDIKHRAPTISYQTGMFSIMSLIWLVSLLFVIAGARAFDWCNVTSTQKPWQRWMLVFTLIGLAIGVEFLFRAFLASKGYTEIKNLY